MRRREKERKKERRERREPCLVRDTTVAFALFSSRRSVAKSYPPDGKRKRKKWEEENRGSPVSAISPSFLYLLRVSEGRKKKKGEGTRRSWSSCLGFAAGSSCNQGKKKGERKGVDPRRASDLPQLQKEAFPG